MFLGQGGHVREDLPAIVDAVRARHPDLAIEQLPAVGEDDAVLDRIAAVCIDKPPGLRGIRHPVASAVHVTSIASQKRIARARARSP